MLPVPGTLSAPIVPFMSVIKPFAEGKPDTRALYFTAFPPQAVKLRKEFGLLLFGNSDAGIDNRDSDRSLPHAPG